MNFKKIISSFLIFIFLIPINLVALARENSDNLTKNSKNLTKEMDELPAKSYILTDYKTGQVLYEKNADQPCAIASITKIMTMLLIVESIEDKKISLEDMVTATENAKPNDNESSLWLEVGEKMSVRDLLKAVAINSANDAARTLAEYVAGSEEAFVDLMNKKAEELKLKNTNFVNASGLDDSNHYSSARDVAIMSKELLKYKWILNYTSTIKGSLRNGAFTLKNTNPLLQTYKGCNGLKTGTEDNAGKCLCATAFKNNMGLCAVCLGSATDKERVKTCTFLLDYGFNNFTTLKLDDSNIQDKEIPVKRGKKAFVGCEYKDKELACLVKKIDARKIKEKIELKDSVDAPIKKGDVLGKISYVDADGKKVFSKEIVSNEDAEKIDFLSIFTGMFKSFFCNVDFYNQN